MSLAGRRSEVEGLGGGGQKNVVFVQQVEVLEDVRDGAGEAIQFVEGDDLDLASESVLDHLPEAGPAVVGAGEARVGVLADDDPVLALSELAGDAQLGLDGVTLGSLLVGGDAGVNADPERPRSHGWQRGVNRFGETGVGRDRGGRCFATASGVGWR